MAYTEAILNAVSKKYISIHLIDIDKDCYEVIKSIEAIDNYSQGEPSAQKALNNVMNHLTQGENRKIINEFTTLSTLKDRLKEKEIIRCSFLSDATGWCEATFIRCELDKKNNTKKAIFLVEDINDQVHREHIMQEQIRKAEEQALRTEAQAVRDPLTNLLNQAGMERSISEFLSMCPAASCVLMTLDIDNFKLINDIFGHGVGDEVLKKVADILREECPKPCFLARNGGDEFTVFFTNTSLEEIRPFFNSFVNQHTYFKANGEFHEFSMSMGAAEYPVQTNDYKKLRDMADAALYSVKMNHKDGYQFYQEGMEMGHREHLGFNLGDVVQGLPGAIVVYKVDTNGHILFANDDAISLFGCEDMQDLIMFSDGSFVNMIHPDDINHVLRTVYDQYRILKNNDGSKEYQDGFVKFRIIDKKGQTINVECSGRRVANKFHGDVVYVYIQESNVKEQYIKMAANL
ncbi:diguanylate cyclase domain-containing protein [Anaerovibrio sp. RM50]|uniref:diguanylate cyclase domain-containing protein n=1 Tax=Anaerovibrio sp. RM50 TaxID=1200557 RepID=UPI0004865E15|nr:diguanylate cyclase [Anaerovibrio sp. RM50]